MAWFRVDDRFHMHPKVIEAGNAAVGLFVRMGAYCSDHLTDGHIPSDVARIYGTKKEIETLVRVGLWITTGSGYHMPDYLEYNPSKAQVDAERAAARERMQHRRSGNVRANTGRSSGDVRLPRPQPDPTPTTKVTTPPTDCVGPDRLVEIINVYADIAYTRSNGVSDEAGWKAAVRKRIAADPELQRLSSLFPTAPPDAVAAWLHGDKGSMAYYPRADELAEVVPLQRKDNPA